MDRARFARIETLFHALLDADPAERARELAAEEPLVRERVEALLANEVDSTTRIGRVVGEAAAAVRPGGPERLGPYRVLGELGRGGFATVYLAERSDGTFSMRVAIKVVRSDWANAETRERLHRERQFLARLQHPNIARILDGGTTEDGAPFVVMELIDGEPIDRYCRSHPLPLDRRLDLFRQVCDAVQFAHRNLILHRDIKPSNILVGTDGVPKLLDFGIAKVLHTDLESGAHGALLDVDVETAAGADPLTRLGTRVLTPEFASPEQMRGEPLDTTTDVYSLGLVLYLLIADRPAYTLSGPWPEMERVICDTVPTPPSRSTDEVGPPRWWRRFGDDLDRIVLRALDKQPARRYPSAQALGDDLRRYRRRLPIDARRDTWLYRGIRFLGRHRVAVAVTSVVSMLLVAAMAITVDQSRVADRQSRRSERAVGLLVEMLERTNPFEGWAPDVPARQVLEEGARKIRWDLRDDPALRAEMMILLGQVFRSLASYDEAERHLVEGLDLLRTLPGDTASHEVAARRELGWVYRAIGRCRASRDQLMVSSELAREELGERHRELALSQLELATTMRRCGEMEAGEALLVDALALRRQVFGDDSEEVVEAQVEIARARLDRGDYERGADGLSAALATLRAILPDGHPEIATLLADLAVTHERRGDPAAALALYGEALDIQRRSLGPRHDALAITLHNIGNAEMARGAWQASEAALVEALDMLDDLHPGDHPLKATCFYSLGRLRRSSGDWAGAAAWLERSLDARRRLFGDDHESVGQSRFALARVVAREDPSRAEHLYRAVAEQFRRILPAGDHRLAYPLFRWGVLKLDRGDAAAAEPLLREAWAIRRDGLPKGSWETAVAAGWLGRCVGRLGRADEARTLLTDAIAQLSAARGEDDPRVRMLDRFLAEVTATSSR